MSQLLHVVMVLHWLTLLQKLICLCSWLYFLLILLLYHGHEVFALQSLLRLPPIKVCWGLANTAVAFAEFFSSSVCSF